MSRPANRTAETIRRAMRSSRRDAPLEPRRLDGDPAAPRSASRGRRAAAAAARTRPPTDSGLLRERLHDVAALIAQQLRGVGLDGIPDVEVRVQRAAHARRQRHRTDDEQEVLGQLERQRAHDIAELGREVAELARIDLLQLGEAHAAEPREQLGHRPLELGGVGRRQQHADVADAVDQALAVARGDGDQEPLQARAAARRGPRPSCRSR